MKRIHILIPLIVLILSFVPLKWEMERVEILRTKVREREREYESRQTLQTLLPKKKQELSLLMERVSSLERRVPSERNMASLLAEISASVPDGVKIISFAPEKEITADFLTSLPFKLKFQGKYGASGEMFERLLTLQRLVSIESIEVEAKDGNLDITVYGRAYMYTGKKMEVKTKK
jgi:Tfp pilus assembly protein PilO